MSSAQAIHPHSRYTGMAFKPIRWHTDLKVERSPRTYDIYAVVQPLVGGFECMGAGRRIQWTAEDVSREARLN